MNYNGNDSGQNLEGSNRFYKRNEHPTVPEGNYQMVPNTFVNDIREGKLEPIDVIVWMALKNHLGENKNCWPSNTTIAKIIGISVRTVIRSTNRLIKANHITRKGKSRFGTKFTEFQTLVKNNKVIKSLIPDKPVINEPLVTIPNEATSTVKGGGAALEEKKPDAIDYTLTLQTEMGIPALEEPTPVDEEGCPICMENEDYPTPNESDEDETTTVWPTEVDF
jgi:hypothetical protein